MKEFCQAAVFRSVGQPFELCEVALPELQPGQTLIRITCCTICGSDLHTWSGARTGAMPTVLGHETIGTVARLSQPATMAIDGRPLQPGDRVTWSVAAACGQCARCANQLPQKCNSLFKYGHELYAVGAELSGGLAEYCVLQPGTAVMHLPSELSDAVACPANCATATVAAAVRQAGSLSGKRVLITGGGMLGLTTCAVAHSAGAEHVCLCDPHAGRRQQAERFGATEMLAAVDADNFDCVFEMSGNASAVEAAIAAAGIGGKIVLVGSVSPSRAVAVDPERIVRRLLSIVGVHNYRPDDLQTAVHFLQQAHHRYPFAALVERTWPLAEVQAAFEFAISERPIRVAVKPDARL